MDARAPTLVTGAAGFIGGYVVRRLLAAGEPVRVLVRRPERLDPACRGRVEIVAGDVRDAGALTAAVSGCATVLHLAACARAWARDPAEFAAVNVDAVARLLATAAATGVERLVHVSTVLTRPPFRPAPVSGSCLAPTAYEASKLAGERLVADYAERGRHGVIVHPTRVYGPGPCCDANAVTRVVALYLAGRLHVRLADGDVQASYVFADDVAAGILLAARRGRSGAHYVLGGENVSFGGLLETVAALSGVRRRVAALPPGLALAAARAAEWWGRAGGTAPITPGWVRSFLEDRRVDLTGERRDLGYAPRPLRQGLADTLRWLAGDGRRMAA